MKLQRHYNNIPEQGNARHTEGWALSEAARRMASSQIEPIDRQAILTAVRCNWRLWTIFQVGLMSPDADVPNDIKVQVLTLSNFVDKRSVSIIADPRPEKLDILILINRRLAAGLLNSVNEIDNISLNEMTMNKP